MILEKLKNAPKGLFLYSPTYGELKFDCINNMNEIRCITDDEFQKEVMFDNDGKLYSNGEVLLFPDTRKNWNYFKIPNIGDIISRDFRLWEVVELNSNSFTISTYKNSCKLYKNLDYISTYVNIPKDAKIIDINIANDFIKYIGIRKRSVCDGSGEEFREDFLEPTLKKLNKNDVVLINLDGTDGFTDSFLDEVFYTLISSLPHISIVNKLHFISDEEPKLISTIGNILIQAQLDRFDKYE